MTNISANSSHERASVDPKIAEAEARLATADTEENECQALVDISRLVRTRDPRRGAVSAEKAVIIARGLGNDSLIARALAAQCNCLRGLSQLAHAAQCGREAVTLFERLDEPAEAAPAHIAYGAVQTLLGNSSEALSAFETARALFQRVGDRAGEADALMDIAVVYNIMGDPERSIPLYDEVLPIFQELNDPYRRATALNNAAYGHITAGMRLAEQRKPKPARDRFLEAVELMQEALPIARTVSHEEFVATCLDTLATAYRELGEFDICLKTLHEQLALAEKLDGRRLVAVTLSNLGEVQRRSGNLDEAIATLERSDAQFAALQLSENYAETLQSLVLAYEGAGRLKEALATHRRYHMLETALRSETAEEKMRVLEARLLLEKAESELVLAYQREAELSNMNLKLNEADQQKSLLLAKLERQTFEDALTGLHNRRSLDQRLSLEFRRSHRYQIPLSVALADLDFFKQINDRLSHAVGDEVLRIVARIMRENIRTTDYAARYGGEEFAFLFPETTLDAASFVCEKIRRCVEEYSWTSIHPDLRVTLSFGVTEDAAYVTSHEELLIQSDKRLYQAKFNGKNQVCSVETKDDWPIHTGTSATQKLA